MVFKLGHSDVLNKLFEKMCVVFLVILRKLTSDSLLDKMTRLLVEILLQFTNDLFITY
jgi:hypothetical protein